MDLTVTRVAEYPIQLPFRDVPGRNLLREMPHWQYLHVCEVELATGHVGYGEQIGHGEWLLYGPWADTTEEDIDGVRGRDALDCLWEDSVGVGLQMALFDAVSRALGQPIHSLLGSAVRDSVPVSWWAIDMSPEDLLAECRTAIDRGYRTLKLKGRPWWDIREQLRVIDGELPEWFEVSIDFNGTLVDADSARRLLPELDSYDCVGSYETPVPQTDVEGTRAVRAATATDVALHYGTPEPRRAVCEALCDRFVVNGGATQVREQAAVAAMADVPFWLQLVGTELTAAFSLQFGAVLEYASEPAVTCHQIFDACLLEEPIRVEGGRAELPEGPGVGAVDADAIRRHRVDPDDVALSPPRLVEVTWPDGERIYAATGRQLRDYAEAGALRYFETGVRTRLLTPEDPDWDERRHERARESPVTATE